MSKIIEPQALHLAASNASTVSTLDKLTPAEMKLIQDFRCLRDSVQETLVMTVDRSVQNPSLRRSPSLWLVSDGRQS